MTSTRRSLVAKALVASALTVVLSATFAFSAPDSAQATPKRAKTITRSTVISRSRHWVKKRVRYSQRGYYRGYRRDCSGFVSMAWRTGRSYSSRTIHRVSHPISYKKAKPGDAVLTRGHVAIFAGWKNKKAKTFYAYEETTWGKGARKTVRRFGRGAKMIRRDGIRDKRRVTVVKHTIREPRIDTTADTDNIGGTFIVGQIPLTLVSRQLVP